MRAFTDGSASGVRLLLCDAQPRPFVCLSEKLSEEPGSRSLTGAAALPARRIPAKGRSKCLPGGTILQAGNRTALLPATDEDERATGRKACVRKPATTVRRFCAKAGRYASRKSSHRLHGRDLPVSVRVRRQPA